LDYGAHSKLQITDALNAACVYADAEHIKRVLCQRYKFENDPLGQAEIVKLLVNRGAEVNIQDCDGNTVLKLTLLSDHVQIETVKVLLDHGAEVNAQDNAGMSALMIASDRGLTKIAKVLLDYGAQVNMQSNDGEFALMFALHCESTATLKLLLDHDAEVNVNVTVKYEHNIIVETSALMIAVENCSLEIIQLLLESGADANFRGTMGQVPLHTVSGQGLLNKNMMESSPQTYRDAVQYFVNLDSDEILNQQKLFTLRVEERDIEISWIMVLK
jgi:ankyrin repeat protein